jgi:hypothetical protein
MSSSMMWFRTFRTDQAASIPLFTTISAEILVNLIMLGTPNLKQHLIGVCYALDRTSPGHMLTRLSSLSTGSDGASSTYLGLRSSGQEFISDE